MRLKQLNRWDLSPSEAIEVQRKLAGEIRGGKLPEVQTVLGVDVSYRREDKAFMAAAVMLDVPAMSLKQSMCVPGATPFPYIPGLLSFREIPPLLGLLREMANPDLIVVDGQGVAHPRGLGLASHVGLITGIPTVGCAKSLLIGECVEPGEEPGNMSPIILNGQTVGYALRSKMRCRALYVSPGHLLDPKEAVKAVKMCLRGYRLPEPTRLADRLSKSQFTQVPSN